MERAPAKDYLKKPGHFVPRTAWAVGKIQKHEDSKRCHVLVLCEGEYVTLINSGHYDDEGHYVPSSYEHEDAVIMSPRPISVSCKMITKTRKLHGGMLGGSWIYNALVNCDFGDGWERREPAIILEKDEGWECAIKRTMINCPFATDSWDCNRCKAKEESRRRENWLQTCAVARLHDK